jgi:ribosomal protein S18 acetylase RimI-like enzyme
VNVRAAEAADRAAAIATLTEAFVADPMLRYLAPDDADYPRIADAFFGVLFDARAFGGGEVRVTDDVSAVSLWNPPGGNRLGAEHVDALFEERVMPRLDETGHERMARFEHALESIHPHEPHWYLGVVGVRADRQGEGLGGRVIRAILDDPIAAGDPAYLVTATERNLAIYRRLGFEIVAETDIRGGPHLWGMWRPVQPDPSVSTA